LPSQPRGKPPGKRRAQVRPAQQHALEARVLHGRLELSPRPFDFGQLRHAIDFTVT
jgi:hypothetical protein